MTAYTVDFSSITTMTAEQFFTLCRANPDVKFERSAAGALIIMSPNGWRNGQPQFWDWGGFRDLEPEGKARQAV